VRSDVARLPGSIGQRAYAFDVHYNGSPASGIAVQLANATNERENRGKRFVQATRQARPGSRTA